MTSGLGQDLMRANVQESQSASNSKNSVSYAILLVPGSSPNSGFKLLESSRGSGNLYQLRVLDHIDKQDDQGMVISRVEAGKYSDFERTKSVTIKLDAINIEWIEKAAVLYYRTDGKYQTLQTSD